MLNLLMPFAGSLVSGGASLLGAKMQGDSNARAARLNAIYQASQNQADRDINARNFEVSNQMAADQFRHQMETTQYQFAKQMESAELDRQLQQEFAKNGVQWRVQDAKAAGLHPLAALGAQISSPSPIQVSGSVPGGNVPSAPTVSSNPISPFKGNDSIASAMSSFGQDLSRAMTASATQWEREKAASNASQLLSIENQSLQNQLLASQVAKTTGASVGPPAPVPSQRSNKLIKYEPLKTEYGYPGATHQEGGSIRDTGFAEGATRAEIPVPSKAIKERIEDNALSEFHWELRNRIMAAVGGIGAPAHKKPNEGERWVYNPGLGQWESRHPLYKDGKFHFKKWWDSANRGWH